MRLIDGDALIKAIILASNKTYRAITQYRTELTMDYLHGLDDAITIIKNIPSADRPSGEWIPCSERLPNGKEIVLITNDKGNVRFGQFRGTHGKYWIWKGNTLETVLAWMPLPKPYGERKGE